MKFNILNNLRLWQKLLLLGLIALLMLAFPFYQYFLSEQARIDFAKTELSGIEPVRASIKVLEQIQTHRGLASRALAGDETSSKARLAKENDVGQRIKSTDTALTTYGDKELLAEWAKISQDWKRLALASADRATATKNNFDEHTILISRLVAFIELIADSSKLSLDPDAQTYFLMQAAVINLPKVAESLAQARGYGAARLSEAATVRATTEAAKGDLTKAEFVNSADRVRLQTMSEILRTNSTAAYGFLQKSFKEMPRIQTRLQSEMKIPLEKEKLLPELTRKEIIEPQMPTFESNKYFAQYTEGIESVFKLNDASLTVLADELTINAAAIQRGQLTISALVLAFTLLGAIIGFLIVRNITGTVNELQESVNKVRAGDLTALGAVASKDEVGDLGRTVNLLLQERIQAQQKAENENEVLNNSVIGLLTTMNDLSQRDLTARAPVTEDIIGTVGDSINQLTDATSNVLRDVTKIAGVVEHASKRVKQQSDAVNTQAEHERMTVDKLVNNLKTATQGMNDVAMLAENSNRAAAEATSSTANAMATVQTTVRGMDAIRETIGEMEKRIKRLGERSQEISQIVGLINTISERTHVLSLNASMQAAMAGDAGRGFAVVAEEVQRLAENSRQATAQIAGLVQNIQIETNDTIATVNKTIDQVVQGSDFARASGEKMAETRDATERLVQLVRSIAASSKAQIQIAEELRVAASEITDSTEKTAVQLTAQNQVTSSLVSASQKLVESVSVFKLPVIAQT